MKTRKKRLSVLMLYLIIIGVVLIAFTTSCSKSKGDNNNANFSGTYYGALATGLYSEADTIAIPATTSSSIVMNTRTGRGSIYSIHGTINGNALTIASQSVTIPTQEATYTVSGTGILTNSTLVIHYAFVSSSNATTNLIFTGDKK